MILGFFFADTLATFLSNFLTDEQVTEEVKLQLVGDGWMYDGHCCIPSCKFQESFAIYDHDWLVFNS